jgi:hypothetical protein
MVPDTGMEEPENREGILDDGAVRENGRRKRDG